MNNIENIHPGEHLKEFITEYDLTVYRLAKSIDVPVTRIDQIVKGKRSITADTAVRLGAFFGNSAQFWLNLQCQYDIDCIDSNIVKNIIRVA